MSRIRYSLAAALPLFLGALVIALAVAGAAEASGPSASSSVHWLADLSEVHGSRASLVSNPNGATATLRTSQLPKGAYTVWWVIWNDPYNCNDWNAVLGTACGFGDLGNAAAGFSVAFATGHVVGSNGVGNFGMHRAKDDMTGVLAGSGLTNPMGAEIHLVVRYHGEIDPGNVPAQIHTIGGGCDPVTDEPCADLQAAAFVQ